jgi:hypothetical protein
METRRIKTAIEFLKDGQSFSIGDLRLGIERNIIIVIGWSQYLNIENLASNQALKELDEIKTLFKRIVDVSQELRKFIVDKKSGIQSLF